MPFDKWDIVFKNGPNKICGRQPLKNLKGYPFKFFKGFLPQILFGQFLSFLSHIIMISDVINLSAVYEKKTIPYHHHVFKTGGNAKQWHHFEIYQNKEHSCNEKLRELIKKGGDDHTDASNKPSRD